MIHLITIVGQSARALYLEENCTADFKALMRTVTSGRVMLVSTKFRSDFFYNSAKPEHNAILKLWTLYAKAETINLTHEDINTYEGREESFTRYFQSINKLSSNWMFYRLYQKAFFQNFYNDQHNPITVTVVGCDQHLLNHPQINRHPLLGKGNQITTKLTDDTFSLAMHIIQNETHSN